MGLNRQQEKLAFSDTMEQAVIRGVAGSGKTTVGVMRVPFLLEKYCTLDDQVLFVTYNKSLITYIEYLYKKQNYLRNMSLFETEQEQKQTHVIVKNIDAIMNPYFTKYKQENNLDLNLVWGVPYEILKDALKAAKMEYPMIKLLSEANLKFLNDEMSWIKGCGYYELELYQKADRLGRAMGEDPIKLPKKSRSRAAIFYFVKQVEKRLALKKQIEGNHANLYALDYIKTHPQHETYKHIIVDEAQDLTKVQLEFINVLRKQHPDSSILFLMDVAQSIYPHAWLVKGRSFKTIGYDMTGKGFRLCESYRTTTEISECAYSLLAKDNQVVMEEGFVQPSLLNKPGEYPIYRHFETAEEQNQYVVSVIENLMKQGILAHEIAVVSKLHRPLEAIQRQLQAHRIPSLKCRGNVDHYIKQGVKLLTMYAIKGLEFKIVILIDLNEGIIPYTGKGVYREDHLDEEAMERKLLYVGMTRAQEKLYLCSYGKASRFIKDIDATYLSFQSGCRMNVFYPVDYEQYEFMERIRNIDLSQEAIRQWIIRELIDSYGYPKETLKMAYYIKNLYDTRRIDLVVMDGDQAFIFIETKDLPIQKLLGILKADMSLAQVSYGIATNGRDLIFLDRHFNEIKDIPIYEEKLPLKNDFYIDYVNYGR